MKQKKGIKRCFAALVLVLFLLCFYSTAFVSDQQIETCIEASDGIPNDGAEEMAFANTEEAKESDKSGADTGGADASGGLPDDGMEEIASGSSEIADVNCENETGATEADDAAVQDSDGDTAAIDSYNNTETTVQIEDENPPLAPGQIATESNSLAPGQIATEGNSWASGNVYEGNAVTDMTDDSADYTINDNDPAACTTAEQAAAGYPQVSLAVTPAYVKAYAPNNVVLSLVISPDEETDKTATDVKWFRENMGNPVNNTHTHNAFETGYADAATQNEGTLKLTASGRQSDLYSMSIDKNGRYWTQIHYLNTVTGEDTYRVECIDVDNIYTPVEVCIRDLDEDGTELTPYTMIDGLYGIPFDLDGSTIPAAASLGFDTVTYLRNTELPVSDWAMSVPGAPFADTAAYASASLITLDGQVNANEDKTIHSSMTKEFYTVVYSEGLLITDTLDLSKGATLTGKTDYTLTGANTFNYNDNYSLVISPDCTLTFNQSASGKTYEIIQSFSSTKTYSGDAARLSNKFGTTYVKSINIASGVDNITLVINDIHVIGNIILPSTGSPKLTLLLDGKSYIRGNIIVPANAEITIDSLNGNNTDDCLIIPWEVGYNTASQRLDYNLRNSNARIGGVGSDQFPGDGNPGGTITINGGMISISTRSCAAGIGGGGGNPKPSNNNTSDRHGIGGDGGTITINGGYISVEQYGLGTVNDMNNPIANPPRISTPDGTGVSGAGIGGGGGEGRAGGSGGKITINGGKVDVTYHTRGAGIGGGTQGPAGDITINNGEINVKGVPHFSTSGTYLPGSGSGAGIGSGSGEFIQKKSTITINGGLVISESYNTGIGRVHVDGANPVTDEITITGGTVYAKGTEGPGIGYWSGAFGSKITITGQGTTVLADSKSAAAIGVRAYEGDPFFNYDATLYLDDKANVRAYSGGTLPAIYTRDNSGAGFYVNATLDNPRPTAITLRVHKQNGDAILKELLLPAGYKHFAYSSDLGEQRTDNILAFNGVDFLGNVVRVKDDSSEIYSVKTRVGYQNHNGVRGALPVKLDGTGSSSYIIYIKHVDVLGNPLSPPVPDIEKLATKNQNISIDYPAVAGFNIEGYYIGDTFTPNVYTPVGNSTAITFNPLTSNKTVYLVYVPKPPTTTLTITKTVTGDYADKTLAFDFKVYFFTDEEGKVPLNGGATFHTTDGNGAPGAILTLADGTVSFKLKHDQCIKIQDIPTNCWVCVEEENDAFYKTSYVDSENPSVLNTNKRITSIMQIGAERNIYFTNERIKTPITGVTTSTNGAVFPLIAFLILSTTLILALRKLK